MKRKTSAQKVEASHKAKLKSVYTFFVYLVAEDIETNPLYRMKDKQCQSEKQEVNN